MKEKRHQHVSNKNVLEHRSRYHPNRLRLSSTAKKQKYRMMIAAPSPPSLNDFIFDYRQIIIWSTFTHWTIVVNVVHWYNLLWYEKVHDRRWIWLIIGCGLLRDQFQCKSKDSYYDWILFSPKGIMEFTAYHFLSPTCRLQHNYHRMRLFRLLP